MKKNNKNLNKHQAKTPLQKNITRNNANIENDDMCSAILNDFSLDVVHTTQNNSNDTTTYLPQGRRCNKKTNKITKIEKHTERNYSYFYPSAKKVIQKFKYNIKKTDVLLHFILDYAYVVEHKRIEKDVHKFIDKMEVFFFNNENEKLKFSCRLELTHKHNWHAHLMVAIDHTILKEKRIESSKMKIKDIILTTAKKTWREIISRRKAAETLNTDTEAGDVYVKKVVYLAKNVNDLDAELKYLITSDEDIPFEHYPKNTKILFSTRGLVKPRKIKAKAKRIKKLVGISNNQKPVNRFSCLIEAKERHIQIINETYRTKQKNINTKGIKKLQSNDDAEQKRKNDERISKMQEKINSYILNKRSTVKAYSFDFPCFRKLLKNDVIMCCSSAYSRKNRKGFYLVTTIIKNKTKNYQKTIRKKTNQYELFWQGITNVLDKLENENKRIWIISFGNKGMKSALKGTSKYTNVITNIIKKENNRNNDIYSIALVR